ncbi:hypothetical protein AB0D83_18780 [Streptomyces decoyicus]|uniref:hypothetical protein n=1 Tax=Streptomyces decoyicus TaxID=249567 RepID=UPI0033E27391
MAKEASRSAGGAATLLKGRRPSLSGGERDPPIGILDLFGRVLAQFNLKRQTFITDLVHRYFP